MEHFDKWLDWVWVPFSGAMLAAFWWISSRFDLMRAERDNQATELRKEFAQEIAELHDRIARAEERQLKAADAMERYIDLLHGKANSVRDELKDYKAEAAMSFASKSDLDKEITRVTVAIADLRKG